MFMQRCLGWSSRSVKRKSAQPTINWISNFAHCSNKLCAGSCQLLLGVGCLRQRASFARTALSWITRRALLTMYPLARSKYIPCVLPTWSPLLPLRNVQTKPTKSCTSVGPVQGTLPRICKRSLVGCFAPPPLVGGGRRNPSVTSRCSNLLPSASADVRCTDDAIAHRRPTCKFVCEECPTLHRPLSPVLLCSSAALLLLLLFCSSAALLLFL